MSAAVGSYPPEGQFVSWVTIDSQGTRQKGASTRRTPAGRVKVDSLSPWPPTRTPVRSRRAGACCSRGRPRTVAAYARPSGAGECNASEFPPRRVCRSLRRRYDGPLPGSRGPSSQLAASGIGAETYAIPGRNQFNCNHLCWYVLIVALARSVEKDSKKDCKKTCIVV